MKAKEKYSKVKLPWFFALITAIVAIFAVGNAQATCYTSQADATAAGATTVKIYGSIYEGAMNPDGSPQAAPAGGAIASGATVMVQNMHHGGPVECYADVTGNTYKAFVPVDGEYVVMYGAPGYDTTSREFTVPVGATADMNQDAFLPPRDAVTGELPRGNALVYALHDEYVNTEDDFPDDPAFPGVHFYVFDEDGNFEDDGIAGQSPTLPLLAGPDITGLYYFTNLPTGEHKIMALPPGVSPDTDGDGNPILNCHVDPGPEGGGGYFNMTSEEGTQCWEVVLRPNDPGTIMGAYLAWYTFIENMGQLTPPATTGGPVPATSTVSGVFWDADGTDPAEIIDNHEVPQVCYYEHQGTIFVDFNTGYHPDYGQIGTTVPGAARNPNANEDCVWPNIKMNRGYAVLWTAEAAVHPHPLATTLADPLTGEYHFDNVPAGTYKIFAVDWTNDYIWEETQIAVQPAIDMPAVDFFIPRFYARLNGHVQEDNLEDGGPEGPADPEVYPPLDLNGLKVNLRLTDGSVWKTVTTSNGLFGDTDGPIEPAKDGYFNFDELAEVEVMSHLDLDYHTLDPHYMGSMPLEAIDECAGEGDGGDTRPADVVSCDPLSLLDKSTRDIGWFTANYRTELHVQRIPHDVGYVIGSVFNDHLTYDAATSTWTSNGTLDEKEDKLLTGVTVTLTRIGPGADPEDPAENVQITQTGSFDEDFAVSQGYIRPYTPKGFIGPLGEPGYNPGDIEVDEWGGIFRGVRYGQYDFKNVAPGTYRVDVTLPNGFSPAPGNTTSQTITVAGGMRNDVDFGANTLIPLAGEIEGGVFDDVFIDLEHQSMLYLEKQGLPHAPVGIYDHLGYRLGWSAMGHPYCYLPQPTADIGGRVCPATEPLGQKPEVERRSAPGVHIFLANDPALPNYTTDYVPLAVNYTFDQGKFKFEADWSLLPSSFIQGPGGGGGAPLPALPANPPVIEGGAPQAMLNVPADGETLFKNAVYSVTDGFNVELTGGKKRNQKGKWNKKLNQLKGKDKSSLMQNKRFQKHKKRIKQGLLAQECAQRQQQGRPHTGNNSALTTTSYVINGTNFGDVQVHSTVALSGQELDVSSWSDTQITALIPKTAIPGPMIVTTTNGISNSVHLDATDFGADQSWIDYLASRTIYVDDDAAAGTGDGSLATPFASMTEAMNNLPVDRPVYVMVAAGSYNENVHIAESDVKIIGAGPYESMIDGLVVETLNPLGLAQDGVYTGTAGPTFFIGAGGMDGSVSNVEISGFTITGGTPSDEGPGGGIFADYGNTNLDINNNIMSGNGGEYGGAIWMHKSNHDVRIWSNLISENGNFGGYSGGISINDEPEYGPAEPALDHIYDDQLYDTPPGTYEIFNNLLYRNYSPDYGGGMALYEVKDHLKIYGNVIMENRSDDHGGGLFFEDSGPVDLYDNVIIRNFATDDGGGVSFEDVGDDISTVKIYNNLIADNIADDKSENTARGGGLSFDDTLHAEVYNNTITGNIVAGTFDPTGGAIDSERHGHEYSENGGVSPKPPFFSDVKVYNNIIWNNWRLHYDIIRGEDLDYTEGTNYVWTVDNIHVDDPAVNDEWNTENNSEALTVVHHNDINGDFNYSGTATNINSDPLFIDAVNEDWHIDGTSPVVGMADFLLSPTFDLDHVNRSMDCAADMGAFEHRTSASPQQIAHTPTDLFGMIEVPVPGTSELHPKTR